MKIAKWLISKWSNNEQKSEAIDAIDSLIREAHSRLLVEEYGEARAAALEAIKHRDEVHQPQTVEYLLTTIEATFLLTGEYEDAIKFFSEYLGRYPQEGSAYRGRGSAQWYLGKLPPALEDYTRAVQLSPVDPTARSGRGQILAEIGESQQALEELDRALQLLKNYPMSDASWALWLTQVEAFIRNGRGAALAGLDRNDEAMDEFKESLLLCPGNAWAFDNRGRAFERIGNRERARMDYETALAKTEPPLSRARRNDVLVRLRQLKGMSS